MQFHHYTAAELAKMDRAERNTVHGGAVEHFVAYGDDLADAMDWAQTPPQWTIERDAGNSTRASHNWDLGLGYEGAVAMAATGWTDGGLDLTGRLAAAMPPGGRTARWGFDVAGDLPDVGRFCAGDPRNMRRRKNVTGRSPVVTLAINICANGSVGAEPMRNFGAAIAGVINQLERNGRRVEVSAHFVARAGRDSTRRYCVGWSVKKAGEQLDAAALAFSVAHPGCFRRLGFSMIPRTPATMQRHGLGSAAYLLPSDLIGASPATIIINGMQEAESECTTINGALAYAARKINEAIGADTVTVTG